MALINVHIGSEPSTSNSTDPFFGVLWDYNLNDQTQLFGVFQTTRLNAEDDNNGTYLENQLGIGVGFSLIDKLSSFVEYFATLPTESQNDEQHILNAGITYMVSDDLQLDFSAGVGLNEVSSNFIGFGISSQFSL